MQDKVLQEHLITFCFCFFLLAPVVVFIYLLIFLVFFQAQKLAWKKADLVWTASQTLQRPRSYLVALPFHCINT